MIIGADPVEAATLGALLLNHSPAHTQQALQRLTAQDFHFLPHRELYERIRRQWENGALDFNLLADETWPVHELRDYAFGEHRATMLPSYADELVRRRLVIEAKRMMADALTHLGSEDAVPAEIMAELHRRIMLSAWDKANDDDGWEHLSTDDLFDPGSKAEWLIPGLLRRRWRLLLAGEEGVGKDTLMRQIGMSAALGWDPFMHNTQGWTFPKRRVLYIDCENERDVIHLQSRLVAKYMHGQWAEEARDFFFTSRPKGGFLNLAEPGDVARLESLIRKREPELLIIGPVYRLFKANWADLENSTVTFLLLLDQLRARFGFSLILHDHLPKGDGKGRPDDPIGSSAKLRWPELGLTLHEPDSGSHRDPFPLARQRGGRAPSQWPEFLERGRVMGEWPWRAVYPRSEPRLRMEDWEDA